MYENHLGQQQHPFSAFALNKYEMNPEKIEFLKGHS
jgi:hypothetical protein